MFYKPKNIHVLHSLVKIFFQVITYSWSSDLCTGYVTIPKVQYFPVLLLFGSKYGALYFYTVFLLIKWRVYMSKYFTVVSYSVLAYDTETMVHDSPVRFTSDLRLRVRVYWFMYVKGLKGGKKYPCKSKVPTQCKERNKHCMIMVF